MGSPHFRSIRAQSVLALLKGLNRTGTAKDTHDYDEDDDRVSFESHPLYRELTHQGELAARHNLENPYYNHFLPTHSAAQIIFKDKILSNYTSYDYLGLNHHPEIHRAAFDAIQVYGTSVNGSRLTSGERQIHRDLEMALAQHYGAEDAICFSSGHAGAVSAISTLAQPQDLILYDAFSHNCITLGAKYSGAARRAFSHNDLSQLEAILKRERSQFRQVYIVSEGLFSMDGDMAPLKELIELKRHYQCILMIDDAHGLGLLGARGHGVFEAQDVDPRSIDLWFGTLSKTLVSAGGYLTGSQAAISIIRGYAPGLVYSCGLSPALAATSLKALEIMKREPARVKQAQVNATYFNAEAQVLGFDTGTAVGAGIVPLMIGDIKTTLELWQSLQRNQIAAFPVLPPGVPANTARLRFFITAHHTVEQIQADLIKTTEIYNQLGHA